MAEARGATSTNQPAAEKTVSGKTSETLSQFVARVLTQLSLSAWLPSAALVLSLAFIVEWGEAADAAGSSASAWTTISAALGQLAKISIGGALLLFVAVVVLTIFTQAFSFEAIRVVEGYWGTAGPLGTYASWRCRRWENRAHKLRSRQLQLTSLAWDEAEKTIKRQKVEALGLQDTGAEVLTWSPNILTWLGAQVKQEPAEVNLTPAERRAAMEIPWARYADSDYHRRLVVIDKKLRDYPGPARCLPTRFGNVMRTHEDATKRSPVETFILDVYDSMPPTLRAHHDEYRNRLDLYASMIYVQLLVTIIAFIRLIQRHPDLAAGSTVIGLGIAWLTYRGVVASARLYGILIVNIALRFPPPA
jgi:hypothetical protein